MSRSVRGQCSRWEAPSQSMRRLACLSQGYSLGRPKTHPTWGRSQTTGRIWRWSLALGPASWIASVTPVWQTSRVCFEPVSLRPMELGPVAFLPPRVWTVMPSRPTVSCRGFSALASELSGFVGNRSSSPASSQVHSRLQALRSEQPDSDTIGSSRCRGHRE